MDKPAVKKKRRYFSRYLFGVSNYTLNTILKEHYAGTSCRISYSFEHKRRLFRKKHDITLWLISDCPGCLIGKAGRDIDFITNAIKTRYPVIDHVKVLEVEEFVCSGG